MFREKAAVFFVFQVFFAANHWPWTNMNSHSGSAIRWAGQSSRASGKSWKSEIRKCPQYPG